MYTLLEYFVIGLCSIRVVQRALLINHLSEQIHIYEHFCYSGAQGPTVLHVLLKCHWCSTIGTIDKQNWSFVIIFFVKFAGK